MSTLIDRKRVRDQVAACTNCKLVKQCTAPVPFSGPSPSRIAIVGEAPGQQEDKKGQPFVGPAGKLLKRELRVLGLDTDTVAFVNVVSCWPNRKPATPTKGEVEACHQNLVDQLGVIQPEFVLLVGSTAVSSYWRSLTVKTVRGNWFQSTGSMSAWCFATLHPSAILRDSNLREGFVADLESFLLGFVSGPWRNWWCAKCNRYTTVRVGLDGLSEYGIPLCARCLSKVSRPYATEAFRQEAML